MNIEKTISEHAVSDILTPMLDSQDRIVTEDVAPLFDKATGLDTPPASGTVTTTIEESRSVITAIIRKAWTATLTMLGGASVISYIAAAYTYLRNRLQGNETYGIPDRRSEISASSPLAANLALLNDRKISDLGNCPDGISFVQMACKQNAGITEIIDNNEPWGAYETAFPFEAFPNLKKIRIHCESIYNVTFINGTSVEEVEMPFLKSANNNHNYAFIIGNSHIKKLYFPSLEVTSEENGYPLIRACSELEELLIPASRDIANSLNHSILGNVPKIRKIVCNTTGHNSYANSDAFFGNPDYAPNTNPDLIHIEFGAGGTPLAYNTDLRQWSPDNALDASRTDLIEEGSTAQNNLQQFLSNFRDYIALRLTDNGSGLTLTLSQAVRNAIHAAEATYGIENIIITQKGWTISPAPN